MSTGSGGGSGLINLTIKLARATSTNEAGKEEEAGNESNDTSDRKDRGNRACVLEETFG